mgnify:CR=1 FL=1|tara:strand:+ start:778 stop:1131 length:354 start_codon:yes stop_codon:yes gene_type:complete
MTSIADKLSSVIQQIMPHLSESTNGIINKIGIVSLTTGGTNAIVTQAIETQNQTWLSISDAVAIVSIVGSLVFIANIVYQFYSSRRKAKCDLYYAEREDQRRQEAHNKAMNDDNTAD